MKAVFSLACAFLLLSGYPATAQTPDRFQRPPQAQPRPFSMPGYPAYGVPYNSGAFDDALTIGLLNNPPPVPKQTTCWGASGLTFCETR